MHWQSVTCGTAWGSVGSRDLLWPATEHCPTPRLSTHTQIPRGPQPLGPRFLGPLARGIADSGRRCHVTPPKPKTRTRIFQYKSCQECGFLCVSLQCRAIRYVSTRHRVAQSAICYASTAHRVAHSTRR
eukprot:743141-Rhodomonas_salina.1